jgi:hypothetical protein
VLANFFNVGFTRSTISNRQRWTHFKRTSPNQKKVVAGFSCNSRNRLFFAFRTNHSIKWMIKSTVSQHCEPFFSVHPVFFRIPVQCIMNIFFGNRSSRFIAELTNSGCSGGNVGVYATFKESKRFFCCLEGGKNMSAFG